MMRCMKHCAALFLSGVMVSATAATPGVDAPPEPGPQRALLVPQVHAVRLSSGMQLLVVPRPGTPLVTAALYLRAGREADPAQQAGLATLTASLLSKGALRGGKPVSASTLARQAEALGSTLDTAASWRTASLQMTVTTPKLGAALALMADVAQTPLLAADELERARTQAIDGLKVTMASPGDVAALAARRMFWGDSVYGAAPTPASLLRLQRADVQRFHAQWYRPERALLVLAGDITEDQARALVVQYFGRWKVEGAAPPEPKPAAATPLNATTVIIDMPGSGQSGVVVAAPFVPLNSPDRRVAEVANMLMGGGYSARLNQEVRIKRGLSYGASSGAESFAAGGLWTAQVQTNHPSAAQVVQLVREEMLRVGRELASADELDARKAGLLGSFARQLESTGGLANQVASVWLQGRPLSDLSTYAAQVQAVTPEQVRSFAAQTWTAQNLRTVVAGDAKAAGAGLRDLDAKALLVDLNKLDLEQTALGAVR